LKSFLARRRTKILSAWLLVSLCILSIFLIVPLARTIQEFVAGRWSRSLFGYTVILVVGGAFLALVCILIFRQKIRSVTNYFWLLLVSALYIYSTLKLWDSPEEAVHFLEYGLLGFLLFRALKFHTKDVGIYFTAFFIGCLVGIFDEILQWIVPLRIWDIRDVGLNALSSGLFQVGLWRGIRPKGISSRMTPGSFRTLSILLMVNVILLGLCLSNTPNRVSAYSKTFPALSSLEEEEPMNRFRYTYEDPDVGEFRSLLSLEEIRGRDEQGSMVYGKTLREWKNRSHKEFVRSYHPFKFPFLFELRTHVEIRNNALRNAQVADDDEKMKSFYLMAYKENLILEKYFGQTLRRSPHRWKKKQVNTIERLIDTGEPYKSSIRFGLVYPWSETILWSSILVLSLVLLAINIYLARTRKLG
jgi:VanZ family protein